MKKIWSFALILLILSIAGVAFQEITYSPINRYQLGKLMKPMSEDYSMEKVYSVDFIGISIHGELYDLYVYKVESIEPNADYPLFSEKWEGEEVSNASFICKWSQSLKSDRAFPSLESTFEILEVKKKNG